MKLRILAALLAALTILLSSPSPVRAERSGYALTEDQIYTALASGEVYARIAAEGCYIYTDRALTDKIFILPRTYYLKVLEYTPDYASVIYCYEDYDYARGVHGFVSPADVMFITTPPTGRSFPNVFLRFEGNGSFYKNNSFDSYYSTAESAGLGDPFFYGYYAAKNQTYCYVLRGGMFGYYSAEVFSKPTLPLHADSMPMPAPVSPPTSSPDAPTNSGDGFFENESNKIVFIAVITLLCGLALYAMFMPKKTEQEED